MGREYNRARLKRARREVASDVKQHKRIEFTFGVATAIGTVAVGLLRGGSDIGLISAQAAMVGLSTFISAFLILHLMAWLKAPSLIYSEQQQELHRLREENKRCAHHDLTDHQREIIRAGRDLQAKINDFGFRQFNTNDMTNEETETHYSDLCQMILASREFQRVSQFLHPQTPMEVDISGLNDVKRITTIFKWLKDNIDRLEMQWGDNQFQTPDS